MSTPTEPGLQIFSEDWLTEAAPSLPDPWRDAILETCEAFQLGNSSDPILLYGILFQYLEPKR